MSHTSIPEDELKVFESLKDIKVVFDVGAREDVDYLILKPGIELHAFEPNPESFKELMANVGDMPNVYLNNFALGDIEGVFEFYGETMGKQTDESTTTTVLVKRLDDYVKDHNIEQIDFLKIDVEGWESQVLTGARDIIKKCRYIQYEQGQSGDKFKFDRLLSEDDFDLYYIGYRNVLGVRKGELMPWMPENPQEGGTPEKDSSHYLKKTLIYAIMEK